MGRRRLRKGGNRKARPYSRRRNNNNTTATNTNNSTNISSSKRVPHLRRGKFKTSREIKEENERKQNEPIPEETPPTDAMKSLCENYIWKGSAAKGSLGVLCSSDDRTPDERWSPVYKCWSQTPCVKKPPVHKRPSGNAKSKCMKKGMFISEYQRKDTQESYVDVVGDDGKIVIFFTHHIL